MIGVPVALMLIMFLALSSQWLAWKVRLPAILFLLISGLLFGPVSYAVFGFHILNPSQLFGDKLFYTLVSLSVSVILFEGCMTLKLSEIKGNRSVVRNLVTLGLLITAVSTAVLSHYLLNFPWAIAAMLGAISSVSGPTVVAPILRSIRPKKEIANIIKWEGMLVDPLGALLAVIVFFAIKSASQFEAFTVIIWHIFAIGITGIGAGIIAGYLLGLVLRRHWVPDYLANLFVLSVVIIMYVIVQSGFDGSGLITVTVMGLMVGNMRNTNIDRIVDFKENLSILLISVLFITLAANVNFINFSSIIMPAILLVLLLQCLVRPTVALVCTLGSQLNWRERLLLGWLGPRGIIAASVAAIFSVDVIQLAQRHQEYVLYGKLLVSVTFIIIIGTVLIESLTAPFLAKVLKVSKPVANGFIIVGANRLARSIAKILQSANIPVQMADTNWPDVELAKAQGINCYYGDASSEYVAWHLDLVGVGNMLGLSSNAHMNTTSAVKYQREFGSNTIFVLPTPDNRDQPNEIKRKYSKRAFTTHLTFNELSQLLSFNKELQITELTEQFAWNQYLTVYANKHVPLFAISPREIVHVFSPEATVKPEPGWRVVSLLTEQAPLAKQQGR